MLSPILLALIWPLMYVAIVYLPSCQAVVKQRIDKKKYLAIKQVQMQH